VPEPVPAPIAAPSKPSFSFLSDTSSFLGVQTYRMMTCGTFLKIIII
jgi:hypothetical protein